MLLDLSWGCPPFTLTLVKSNLIYHPASSPKEFPQFFDLTSSPPLQKPNDLSTMPLDTSTYNLALLRLDGRRWNELRRLTAQISTQASADGSSYLEMGNTKVICTVSGPAEPKGTGGARAGGNEAEVRVEITIAGFSGVDRKRRGRNDKYAPPTLLTSTSPTSPCPRSTIAPQYIRENCMLTTGE
jgi:hypothetical protein